MGSPVKRGVVIAAVILAAGVAIRLPFVLIPPAPNGLYNVDELALALSVVDQWLGLPPIDLCWPGIPLRFFTFVAFAPEFLWSLATDRSLLELSRTISRHYDDPSSLILAMRLLSAVSGATVALIAYGIVDKLAKDTLAAAAAALVVTFVPLAMQQSLIGTNDMVALMFAMAAAYGIVSSPARPVLAGVASAAVVATKVALAVWLVPVFVGGAVFLYQREGVRVLLITSARCLCAGTIGLVLFFPYLWLQPVRAIKAVLAAVLAHTNSHVPDVSIFSAVISGKAAVTCLIAAIVVAVIIAWNNDRWGSAALALGLLLAALFAFFLWSGFDYWRYMLGALVPGVILFAVICAGGRRVLFASALTGIALVFGSMELWAQIEVRRATSPSLFTSIEDMCRRGETVWLYDQVLAARYYRLPMPNAAVAEVAAYFAANDKTVAMRNWLTAAKVNPAAADALQTDFDEVEQVHLARWRAMAVVDQSSLTCPFHFFRYGFGETETDVPTGYVRGTFTDKSLRDVRAVLDRSENAEVINVIGPAEALAGLNLPTRRIDGWIAVVTKGAAN